MSVLTDPGTYGILNSELTNGPRTHAVLGELAAQWQQMMGTLHRIEQEAVSSQCLANAVEEHREDRDRRDCRPRAGQAAHQLEALHARSLRGWDISTWNMRLEN